METNPSAEQLEQRAALEREEVSRDLARVRRDLRRELDFRGRLENGIRTRPALAYGCAGAASVLTGYLLARLVKA